MRSIQHPEEWRKIKEVPHTNTGYYEASNLGRVRHVWNNGNVQLLKPFRKTQYKHGSDFYKVKLHSKEYRLSNIVYRCFAGEIPEGCRIVYKNGLKEDNSIYNLIPVPLSQFGKYSASSSRIPVAQINESGEIINIYPSIREAARQYKYISYQTIHDRCNHKVKHADILPDGTTFRYAEELGV